MVEWIIMDITDFKPTQQYDVWHDRATFHFLIDERDISHYISIAQECLSSDGILIVGTFSDQGHQKCSGIEITQYSEYSMTKIFRPHFEKIHCRSVQHLTPFTTLQDFTFCSFKKAESVS